jgi:AcrR family transcriptional regulator
MQKRSEATRNNILQAAMQLFASRGYDATSVAQICQAAGVSKGAFYHHFPSKQAVFVALLDNWLNVLDEQIAALVSQAGSIPEGLVQMASVSEDVFKSARGQLPMFLEFWRESSHDPLVWNATIEPYRHYTNLFSGLIERGIQEGSLEPVDPQTTARVLLALVLGVILQGVMDPEGAAWNDVLREGIQLIMMKGLARENR